MWARQRLLPKCELRPSGSSRQLWEGEYSLHHPLLRYSELTLYSRSETTITRRKNGRLGRASLPRYIKYTCINQKSAEPID